MKHFYLLMIVLSISTAAFAQILKTEKDLKTSQEIKSAVTLLGFGNDMGQQLNFFARGEEKLVEFVWGKTFMQEMYPPRDIKALSIVIKLKNDSLYTFRTDSTKYTITDDHGFPWLSIVAHVHDRQLAPLRDNQVATISLAIRDEKPMKIITAITDQNRREIKKAVAYIIGAKPK